ncbi:L-threonate dehydrogenase [Camellia lanceoleosa]|uniref:L-threonate dehydrogenase n=1 Tax=Camellia lanceoleosa TaxID=1840588 RepID=A0ACC0HZW4_9ERIC|nr:L-threonate dehydrogenase [Camellia lanceoleosa]
MASQSVIGFIGLDQLSLQLASSLLCSGYAVQAFETCNPLLDEFTNQGRIRCASPVEARKDVVALVVLISHADQINDLLFGHESALKGLHKDVVIILHSTILPAHIQKLEKRLTGNLFSLDKKNICVEFSFILLVNFSILSEDLERVFVIDIYVSKGMSEVLNGKIMIISSGQSDAITRARPILSAMSEKLYVFEGALGAGRVFKNHVPQLLRDNQTKHLLNTFVQNLGIVLDMAKSCTFPLLLLAVAFQQLLAGSSRGHGNDGDETLIKCCVESGADWLCSVCSASDTAFD